MTALAVLHVINYASAETIEYAIELENVERNTDADIYVFINNFSARINCLPWKSEGVPSDSTATLLE